MSASQGNDRLARDIADFAEQDAEQRRRVLDTLMDAYPAPTTRGELETAVGSVDASDGLHPLVDAGAVHVRGDVLWPSRCAVLIYEL